MVVQNKKKYKLVYQAMFSMIWKKLNKIFSVIEINVY